MIATKVTPVKANDLVSMSVKDGSGVARQPAPCDGFLVKAGDVTVFLPSTLISQHFTLPQK